jgi:predicted secreted protein
MAADIGRNLLVKMGTGTAAVTVAAMRTTSFTVNGEAVDTTNKDSGGFGELLGTAGVSTLEISAAGVLTGSTTSNGFFNRARNKSIDAMTLVLDGTNTITGNFQTLSFSGAGAYNGEQTYDVSLRSSGTFSAFA